MLSIPSFIGTLPATVKHFLRKFPAAHIETRRRNDHERSVDGHGAHPRREHRDADFSQEARSSHSRRCVSHMPDIGGRIRNAGIRDIFEEGLQIPQLKLINAGKPEQNLLDMIARMCAYPKKRWATSGRRSLPAKCSKSGCSRCYEIPISTRSAPRSDAAPEARNAQSHTCRARRRVSLATQHDGFEEPIVINCTVTVKGEKLAIDYTGSSAQVPRAVNVVPIYTFAYSAYAVKALLCPDVPNNEGSFTPITTSAPLGSIFNPHLSCRERRARHDRSHDGAGDHHGARRRPARASDRGRLVEFVDHRDGRASRPALCGLNFMNAGQGATKHRNGYTMLSFPSNLRIRRSKYSSRWRRYAWSSAVSGAAAAAPANTRGGDGLHFEVEVAAETPMMASMIMTRFRRRRRASTAALRARSANCCSMATRSTRRITGF